MADKAPNLNDAVLNYLNLRDAEYGSQQDYDDAINAMAAALPDSHVPRSVYFGGAPASTVADVVQEKPKAADEPTASAKVSSSSSKSESKSSKSGR